MSIYVAMHQPNSCNDDDDLDNKLTEQQNEVQLEAASEKAYLITICTHTYYNIYIYLDYQPQNV